MEHKLEVPGKNQVVPIPPIKVCQQESQNLLQIITDQVLYELIEQPDPAGGKQYSLKEIKVFVGRDLPNNSQKSAPESLTILQENLEQVFQIIKENLFQIIGKGFQFNLYTIKEIKRI